MELKQLFLHNSFSFSILLIVPYGIETRFQEDVEAIIGTFNRTLWN